MSRPSHCKHILYPSCGCVQPPALASHLILERDRKLKAAMEEAAKPKKPGRPAHRWTKEPDADEVFLESLPDIVEDPYSRQKLLMLVDAQLCRQSLSEFVRQAWHVVEPTTTLEWNWHHEFICTILQGLFEDWEHATMDPTFKAKVLNTIFNVPPGSLKSRLLCVMFPVWCWLRKPGTKFLCLSVNEQAAHRDARDARGLIVSDWFQNMFAPDWQLKDDQTAISNYGTTKGGIRLSKALGAEVVGQRADILILDDPNNPKESESKVVRESVNEVWRTNIFNRINHPESSMRIGIQQRVHSEDWTGFVLHKDNGAGEWSPTNRLGWLLVALPAEFEPERKCVTPWGEDIRTVKGEPLHNSRMTPEFLEGEKKRFGSQKYAGQMQQRPTLAEGGMVKLRWWRFFHYEGTTPIEPGDRKLDDEINKTFHSVMVKKTHGYGSRWDFDWTVISLDPAAKATERGSQHGILVISGKGPQRFIRADKTFRGDVLEVIRVLLQLCKDYDPNRIIIEAKAAGPALMTMFEDHFQRGAVLGSDGKPLRVVVDDIDPQGDKTSRLDACLPELESGLVHLLDNADWLPAFTGEVCGYPLSTYNDRPDALSQALNHMRTWNSYQLPSW